MSKKQKKAKKKGKQAPILALRDDSDLPDDDSGEYRGGWIETVRKGGND